MDTLDERYAGLVANLLAGIDTTKPELRQAGYAKAREIAGGSIDKIAHSARPELVQNLRARLEKAISAAEARYASPARKDPIEVPDLDFTFEDEPAEAARNKPAEEAKPDATETASDQPSESPAEPSEPTPADEADETSPPAVVAPPAPRRSAPLFVAGALCGVVLAAIAAAGAYAGGYLALGLQPKIAIVEPGGVATSFAEVKPVVDGWIALLDTVETKLKERQAADPAALTTAAGGKAVGLKAVLPEIDAAIPAELRRDLAILVRANATAYKIVFRSPLCPAVAALKPELVDQRKKPRGIFCTDFGKWNAEGEAF